MFGGIEEDASPEVTRVIRELEAAKAKIEEVFEAIAEHRKNTRARAIPVELRSAKEAALARKSEVLLELRSAKTRHRAQFDSPNDEFLRRKTALTSSTSLEELRQVSGEDLRKLITKIRDAEGPIAPRTAERINSEILEAMLAEPDWSEVWKAVTVLERVMLAMGKEARKASRLPHGTYALAEDAFEAAKRDQKVGDLQRKWAPDENDLPVDDTGRVGVQLIGGLNSVAGLTIPELLAGTNARLRLSVESAENPVRNGKSARWLRRNSRAVVTLAIDSSDAGWQYLDIPISYHRPLPEEAVVKWAWLFVQREGRRLRYNFQFTIVLPDEVDQGFGSREQFCVINPGWRNFEDGTVRVAYVVGSDGHCEDFRLPATEGCRYSLTETMEFVDSIRSASDLLFNEVKGVVARMLPTLSVEIQKQCLYIGHWRNHKKLHRIIRQLLGTRCSEFGVKFHSSWVKSRKSMGLDLMPKLDECPTIEWYLYCWTLKDAHLYQMTLDRSKRAIRDRDQQFVIWANKLANRYQKILISEGELKSLGKKSDTTATPLLKAKSRAASGKFLEKLREKFGLDQVVKDKGVNASRTCVDCKHLQEADISRDSRFQCSKCGLIQDQDETNCRNRSDWYRAGRCP